MLQPVLRSKYLDGFFPKRGGIKPSPIKDWNYTEETLSYMSPAARADEITTRLTQLYGDKPFLLIDATAGIGGNTLSFLEKKQIGLVISYEADEDRRRMLKRNIQSYGEAFTSKSIVPDSAFDTRIPLQPIAGCCIFFDPPWLPSDVRGHLSNPSQYILSGIKVGVPGTEMTIEDFLSANRAIVYAFGLRVPPGYILNEVPGWNIHHEDLPIGRPAKARFYYGVSSDEKLASAVAAAGGGIRPYSGILQKREAPLLIGEPIETPPAVAPESDRVPASDGVMVPEELAEAVVAGDEVSPAQLEKLRIDLSIGVPPSSDEIVRGDVGAVSLEGKGSVWKRFVASLPVPVTGDERELSNYIQALIRPVVGELPIKDDFITDKAMEVWERAFTHNTINPENNYEVLETRGDAILSYVFPKYLIYRFPSITPQGITEYKHHYMAKTVQAELSRQMGLDRWVRITEEISITSSVQEDLFESFFGALDQIADSIKPGLGAALAYDYMLLLFNEEKFDLELIKGAPKTRLFEVASRLRFNPRSDIGVRYNEDGPRHVVSYFFKSGLMNALREKKIPGYDPRSLRNPIGTGQGGSKARAEHNAAANALRQLESVGITHEWIASQQERLSFENFPADLVERVFQKARAQRYRLHWRTLTKEPNGVTVQLNGVTKDNRTAILARGSGGGIAAARRNALDAYVRE